MGELRACADSFSERPKFLRDIAFTKFSYFLYENDDINNWLLYNQVTLYQ